jgi:hypothetical protein
LIVTNPLSFNSDASATATFASRGWGFHQALGSDKVGLAALVPPENKLTWTRKIGLVSGSQGLGVAEVVQR